MSLQSHLAGHQKPIPVILTTWEAEIKRIIVLASLGREFKRPHRNRKELGVMVHTCYPGCR
jgi:hypothetical protein